MPIFRAGGKLIFYAHVPKCGGTTVFSYLRRRFGAVAFYDSRFASRPEDLRWSRTSPQHVDAASLARMFPPKFFDIRFAVVRHPVARLVSAFHYAKESEGTIAADRSFSDWLRETLDSLERDPFLYDNHVRPMVDMVPPGARVFQLELGLDGLVPWLDEAIGAADGPRRLGARNERAKRSESAGGKAAPSDADLDLIARVYAADFERFGYAPGALAPARAVTGTPAPPAPPRGAALVRTVKSRVKALIGRD